ncbi:MAG: hypothetical protein JJT85_05645 [Chromatiales bacterium]|nr:hypothetical protein [Chromatiales bacterium]
MNQPARLGGIVGTTISAPSIGDVHRAWERYLNYLPLAEGQVDAELARAWNAPAMKGARWLTMRPAANPDFTVRVVEHPHAGGYRAFTAHGWNAAEIMVEDVDAMADALAGSSFRIVGEPADLGFCPDIRAMQVVGPAGELLYLTQFKKPVPGLDVPVPKGPVDRAFIMILGGPSLAPMQSFYQQHFGVPEAPVLKSRVIGMAEAFGMDREHRFDIAALPLAGQSLIEIDAMPAAAKPLPEQAARLPSGISIVSFRVPELPAEAARAHGAGYLRGAAGELLELFPA